MEACTRCEKVRELVHGSGRCRSCYVRLHATTAVCVVCSLTKQIQGHGRCRKCYLAQPHIKKAKNAQRREKYHTDPEYRRRMLASNKEGLRSTKQRNNNWRLYRLTAEAFTAMFEAQGHKCDVCRRGIDRDRKRGVCVDHCHVTGEIRGLLCPPCNIGLGLFQDDPDRIEAAAAYLRRHRGVLQSADEAGGN